MAAYWENSCSFGLRYVSWYKYLIVYLFFSHLGFWSGNLFLIFAYLYLLVNAMSLNVPISSRRKYELVTLITKMMSESVKEQDFVEQAFQIQRHLLRPLICLLLTPMII